MPIHQEISIKSSAENIFKALTNADTFSALTGMPAQISAAEGGKFSSFGGMISGTMIEIIPNGRLVQAWRVGNWDDGVYSIVKFELEKVSEVETRVVFDHTGFPAEHKEHLTQGWHERYWQPMKKYLES